MNNLQEIIAKYGSPAYVYDLDEIRQSYNLLRSALPSPSVLYYSLKANPHPYIVSFLQRRGCYAEVSSIQELTIVLKNGGDPARCLFTGPGKSNEEIEFAIRNGVIHYSVDSSNEALKVAQMAQRFNLHVRFILRINPDHSLRGPRLTMTGNASQFGMDPKLVSETFNQLRGHQSAEIAGFQIYIGTNVHNSNEMLDIILSSIQTIRNLSNKFGFNPELVLLGGGFGHPFAKEGERIDFRPIRDDLEKALDTYFPGWHNNTPTIAFESGRYLVAACGMLISKIEEIKMSKGKRFIILDTGIHHIGGMTGLNRTTPHTLEFKKLFHSSPKDSPSLQTDIVGPLCTPLDFLHRKTSLDDVKIGDIVTVPNVGAYGLTASLIGFLSKPTPIEIIVEHNQVRSVSRLMIERHHINLE